jgi:hypothetical protein
MEFFKTSEGRMHNTRIAGAVLTIGLLPGCPTLWYTADPVCIMRATYCLGWWLSFCDKRPAQSAGDLLNHSRRLLGLALMVVGLIGSFYFVRHKWT